MNKKFQKAEFKKKCDYAIHYEFCLCYLCGKPITKKQKWNLDHVIPRADGGESSEKNLRPVHVGCNHKKGALTLDEYRQWLELETKRNGGKSK